VKLTEERPPTGVITLEQRMIVAEPELRDALDGLRSMKLMQAAAPKDKKLVRVVLIIETPDAPKSDPKSEMEVRWNPFGR
jgi:hypothetical protein